MTDRLDPKLEALFEAAEQDLTDEAFIRRIGEQLDGRRRRLLAGRITVLLAIVALEFALQSPLQQSLGIVADLLGTPVFTLRGDWLEFALGPINTVAGIVGAVLVSLHLLIRRIVH